MTAYWWDKDKNAVAISYKDNRLILTVDDAQALLRQLEMLLPERPSRDEPEEPGFYRTRTGAFSSQEQERSMERPVHQWRPNPTLLERSGRLREVEDGA